MKESLRQSMACLHTWAGLLFGWLLFVIFVTGTSAVFRQEITRWMQPEVAASAASRPQMIENAARWLAREAKDTADWTITLPGNRGAAIELFWSNADGGFEQAQLDPGGNRITARETRGGEFLYRFHFELYGVSWLWGRWTVGIAAMLMLVAILSGVITHKKIFADFFMMRLRKGQRSWLDAHNVTGVLVLPFHIMITYTGLMTMATMYMPWGMVANYADPQKFYDAVYPYPSPPEKSGEARPLAPIAPMAAAAESTLGQEIGSARILNAGDKTAQVILRGSAEDRLSARATSITFDGVTGREIAREAPRQAAAQTESVMLGLHTARFAQPVLRWLYFISGLGGCAMTATGLILWTVKRRAKLPDPAHPHFGFRLVEKLNVATIAGFPASVAVYFLANRLIPAEQAGRGRWEVNSLFIAWGVAALWAFARPARRGWTELLTLAAALFALVPLVSWIETGRTLPQSLSEGDGVFVGFELTMFALAAVFAYAARKAGRHRLAATPARVRRREAVAA
ncbi:PepSY-associated TM helix domain-containing protein [Sphingomonas sp. ID0503]|uniref:PepSY-associated TM helix domain-containing protein n=1 Tax=Sphingomonas sp. ID0503 TaxID=3399691 RepID=UPI003AFA56A4